MTEIEQKALALVNEVREERGYCDAQTYPAERKFPPFEALCRAIEQHEAFRREVSDAVRVLDEFITGSEDYKRGSRTDGVHLADGRSVKFARFIIAKPDPLAEAWIEATGNTVGMEPLNAALAARGLQIVKKEPSQ